ncbi:MAG: hypothetical protein QM831_15450 [Kofleriaceae bacterium]
MATAAACGSPQQHSQFDTPPEQRAQLAADDEWKPSYGKPEIEKALIAERGAEATNERRVEDADNGSDPVAAGIARADLGVRQQFIASLVACRDGGHLCPPRLDDPAWKFTAGEDLAKPPLDTPLRFDLDDWQKMTAELHGRACACRTINCLDSLDAVMNELEQRPTQDVRADEQATTELARARECTFRLRGKAPFKPRSSVE